MIELSIEEKARRYDEAIERAKNFIENGDERERTIAESIFAGIMEESEDERIRKALMQNLKERFGTKGNMGEGLDMPDVLAWLEKQGEQKSVVVIPKFRVGDVIRPKGSTAEYTIESISGECYHGKGWGLHISCDNDYELVGQKPTEWSKEDENHVKSILSTIECCKAQFPYASAVFEAYNADIEWLKSLRPQKQWRPTEEQVNALRWVLNNIPYNKHKEEISGLLDKLKDL